MVAEGRFRSDLYYRLNVYTIRLPPLRERGDDLPLLVKHFVRRFGRELGKDTYGVTPEAMDELRRYPWPGNVRELQSVLKQALLQTNSPILAPESLAAAIPAAAHRGPAPAPPRTPSTCGDSSSNDCGRARRISTPSGSP